MKPLCRMGHLCKDRKANKMNLKKRTSPFSVSSLNTCWWFTQVFAIPMGEAGCFSRSSSSTGWAGAWNLTSDHRWSEVLWRIPNGHERPSCVVIQAWYSSLTGSNTNINKEKRARMVGKDLLPQHRPLSACLWWVTCCPRLKQVANGGKRNGTPDCCQTNLAFIT